MAGRRVPINVFVGHTDNDSVEIGGHPPVPLRQHAKVLLEEDLLVCAIVVPEDKKRGKLPSKVLGSISDSDYFLLLLTDAAIRQPWVTYEIGAAHKSLAASRAGSQLTDDERLDRFFILVPDIARKRPEFSICDPQTRTEWIHKKTIRPIAIVREKKGKGPRLFLTWRNSVRTEHVRQELGNKFLDDVFHKDNRLSYVLSKAGQLPYDKYELWVNAFAAWSGGRFFAVSRQPLMYWWKGDGLVYRERLRRLFGVGGKVRRLSIWKTSEQGYPLRGCSSLPDNMVAKTVGRPVGFKYCCKVAKVFDMLLGFQRSCHSPAEDACYVFSRAASGRVPSAWWELLQYNDDYVVKTKSPTAQTMPYKLTRSSDDKDAEHFSHLFHEIKDGTIIINDVSLLGGPTVPAAGTIAHLLEKIGIYHKQNCRSGGN